MDRERMRRNVQAFCEVGSVSHTPGERAFPAALQKALLEIPYFKEHPQEICLFPVSGQEEDGEMVFALLPARRRTRRTLMLLSHFDVVGVDEYGALAGAAFDPERYTRLLREGRCACPGRRRRTSTAETTSSGAACAT